MKALGILVVGIVAVSLFGYWYSAPSIYPDIYRSLPSCPVPAPPKSLGGWTYSTTQQVFGHWTITCDDGNGGNILWTCDWLFGYYRCQEWTNIGSIGNP